MMRNERILLRYYQTWTSCFFAPQWQMQHFALHYNDYYIRQVNVVNGGGYIVMLAVCPSVSSL